MNITKLKIKDMWSFDSAGAELTDIGQTTLLIGPNNSGKSNVLKAIEWFGRNKEWIGKSTEKHPTEHPQVHEYPEPEPLEAVPYLSMSVELTKEEVAGITRRLVDERSIDDEHATAVESVLSAGVEYIMNASPDAEAVSSSCIQFTARRLLSNRPRKPTFRAAIEQLEAILPDSPSFLRQFLAAVPNEKIRMRDSWRQLSQGKIIQELHTLGAPKAADKEARVRFRSIRDNFRILTGLYDLEIRTEHSGGELILEWRGRYLKLESFGDGMRDLLMFAYDLAAARGCVFLIEDPELRLHPQLQLRLLEVLRRDPWNQFVLTTHSPTLLNPKTVGSAFRVSYNGERSCVRRIAPTEPASKRELIHILSAENNEKIPFASFVVLVEGWMDRLFWIRLLRLISEKAGEPALEIPGALEVVDVKGKHNFEKYRKWMGQLGPAHCMIADFDHLAELGTTKIKPYFKPALKKINESLFKDKKSRDGMSLFEHLERAVKTGDLTELAEFLAYVKSRHSEVRADLSSKEETEIGEFVDELAKKSVFVLRRGELEDYLPAWCRDGDKLLDLIVNPNFEELCSSQADHWDELNKIARAILKKAEKERQMSSGMDSRPVK